jgi:hypothetical protein
MQIKEREESKIRQNWNYFKRGKSELNFLLNVYQTLVLIWGIDVLTKSGDNRLIIITVVFGVLVFISSLLIGKYSLEKVDTQLVYINPFVQDVVKWRYYMAVGMHLLSNDDKESAIESFESAILILEGWLNDDKD